MTRRWVGIGEIKIARRGDSMAAVLGSCVSIILWHAATGTALMNHVLLPERLVDRGEPVSGRYADESWRLMLQLLQQVGIPLRECVCHVVGGGYGFECSAQDVGGRNAEQVLSLLQQSGVRVDSCDVGGNWYRTVHFCLDSGQLSIHRYTTPPYRVPAGRGRQLGAQP